MLTAACFVEPRHLRCGLLAVEKRVEGGVPAPPEVPCCVKHAKQRAATRQCPPECSQQKHHDGYALPAASLYAVAVAAPGGLAPPAGSAHIVR